jgi:putative endonuclease
VEVVKSLPGLGQGSIFRRGKSARPLAARDQRAITLQSSLPGLTRQSIIKPMTSWVYILASERGGTLYIGVTSDLVRRIYEHRESLVPGFTKRYKVKMLVYFEQHDTITAAIQREKNIKHWPREWKIDLILSKNSEWRDLYDEIAS